MVVLSMKNGIFLNGIWKSGNHLLVKLGDLMGLARGDVGFATSSILGNYYLLRQLIRGPWLRRSPVNIGLEVPVSVSASWIHNCLTRNRGRAISGHAAYSTHLSCLLEEEGYKTIQILRDPRDVITSFAHWIETRPDFYAYSAFKKMNIEERMLALIKGFRHNSLYFESFATVLDRSYGWLKETPDTLIIRFEDLVGSAGGGTDEKQLETIDVVAKFINTPICQPECIADKLYGGTKTFRKGQIGNWKKEFTQKVSLEFNTHIGDRLNKWGYNSDS